MSQNVARYAELMREMLRARSVGDSDLEQQLHDEMDSLWYGFSEEERKEADAIDFEQGEGK